MQAVVSDPVSCGDVSGDIKQVKGIIKKEAIDQCIVINGEDEEQPDSKSEDKREKQAQSFHVAVQVGGATMEHSSTDMVLHHLHFVKAANPYRRFTKKKSGERADS